MTLSRLESMEWDEPAFEKRMQEYEDKRRARTAAALELCPANIRKWLIQCTSDDLGDDFESAGYSTRDGGDDIEWFSVGHNSTHYFSFGVRPDGVFIQKVSGPEYSKECECWYDSTTVRVITAESTCQSYWGHM